MKKALIALGVIVAVFLVIQWSRADYLDFTARREDWHRRCDAYVGKRVSFENAGRAANCEREAAELVAYARQKGWSK